MYRIFCESYKNYIGGFEQGDARLHVAEPFDLIADLDKFTSEREENTAKYKTLCDILRYAEQNIDRYPRLKAFLWTVSSRGIMPRFFGVTDDADLEERVKLLNSFLKLTYWE